VRLVDIPRTPTFRLVLLFLALFGAASLLLFGFMYLRTSNYLTSRVDDFLTREQRPLVAAAPAIRLDMLAQHGLSDPMSVQPFGLFSPSGAWIAGNLPAAPVKAAPLDRPFEFTLSRSGASEPYRALAHRLPSGEVLVVSDNISDHRDFKSQLVVTMGWGSLIAFGAGVLGAAIMAVNAMRRIDAVTASIQQIMKGDLGKRLPTNGGSVIDRLALVVNRMLDEIERLVGDVKGVTDGIAHDLRTPLTRLLAGLERVERRDSSKEEYAVAVEQAIEEVGGILRTFNALLRVSEIEDGARRAGFTRVDLAEVAADVVEFYEPAAEGKGVLLTCRGCDRPGALLVGDPSLLFEAVANLVDNAIKFTPAGGRVEVEVTRHSPGPSVTVRDTGPGIDPGDVETVLQPFRRGEKSRHTAGSGLGLTLVAAVAKLHGLPLSIGAAEPGCRVKLG
jgi:signal transduction histidine kinase